MQSVGVLVVHGIGDTSEQFYKGLHRRVSAAMPKPLQNKVAWQPVYYQAELQPNQERLLAASMSAPLDWLDLRRFVLYALSDAATLESRPGGPNSAYLRTQRVMLKALASLQERIGPRAPVIIVAHSMGCQFTSNYLWDAQKRQARAGVFADDTVPTRTLAGQFLRLKTLRTLFTTGCNIPIFVAGMAEGDIRPIETAARGWSFDWHNYYDPDDILGWPLRTINAAYAKAVTADHAVNAGGLTSWTPLSHNHYWRDRDVVRPIARQLEGLLSLP